MIIFPAYAKAAGIDPKSVKFVPSSPQSLPQLLAAGSVDAIGQFAAGKPLLEKAAGGKTVTMLPYADKLPDLYGNGLLVSATKLDSDRAEVEKFTAALVKGLIYAVEHPEEAAQLLKKHDRTADEKVAAAELTEMPVRPGRRRDRREARPGAGGGDDQAARRHRHPQVDAERR
ncbi:ABC transporter substrate-binding protein [Micromonospora peucetia]|uniref:ABC transporter substrate-binding protein n=1 Tax=Micromonospora peucetia TaxID=47871 RepID=UPI001FE0306C|nr:ABC transporter substrate-binding protein [Micromonospora peucetia]